MTEGKVADSAVRGGPPGVGWRRFRYPESLIRYFILLSILVFLAFSVHYLNVDLGRLLGLFERVGTLLANRYYPPDVAYVLEKGYLESIVDTLQMALVGGFIGVVLAIPIAWLASHNVTPGRRSLYPMGRLSIMTARAIHEMIWTILFVSVLGFGMLSGTMALTMFCIGFAGKLFADEIEAIDMGPVEALRAAGANNLQVFAYAVLPQVRVAFTGISIYTWDVAFRAATVVGFFGGGGMGWYLKRNIQQLETERVGAIILSIIVLVLIAEVFSGWLRLQVNKGK
jgi:phosphonate transport system permease protein